MAGHSHGLCIFLAHTSRMGLWDFLFLGRFGCGGNVDLISLVHFTRAQQFDHFRIWADQPGFLKGFQVNLFSGCTGEIGQIHDCAGGLEAGPVEPASGEFAEKRHLSSLEARAEGIPGTGACALVAATTSLAMPIAFASSQTLLAPVGTCWNFIFFHGTNL